MQELSPEQSPLTVLAGVKIFSPFDYQTAATMDRNKLEILQEFHAGCGGGGGGGAGGKGGNLIPARGEARLPGRGFTTPTWQERLELSQ